MSFKRIEGNDHLLARLTEAIRSNHVSHAYVFEGEAALNKKAFAEAFAKAMLCREEPGIGCDRCVICNKIEHGNHEDLISIEADGRSIKDEVVEMLQNRLRTKPFGERNIAIISDADTMTLRAQNRLLKTLEEPPPGVVIILLSENTEHLTQTVLSRCVKYRLQYFDRDIDPQIKEIAVSAADMLIEGAPFYKINGLIREIIKDDGQTKAFLDVLEQHYRDLLLGTGQKNKLYKKTQIYAYVDAIEQAKRQLQQGVAKSYAVKNLMIVIGG